MKEAIPLRDLMDLENQLTSHYLYHLNREDSIQLVSTAVQARKKEQDYRKRIEEMNHEKQLFFERIKVYEESP